MGSTASIWQSLHQAAITLFQWVGDISVGEFLVSVFSGLLVWVTLNLVREGRRTTKAANNVVARLGELTTRIHQATQAQEKAAGAAERYAFTVQSDALRWATDTYFRLEDEMRRAVAETDPKRKRSAAERYFEQLWGLQQVQYALRKLGTLPEHSYATWLVVRDHHYRNGSDIAGMTQKDGLEHAKKWMMDAEFAQFVDSFIGKGMNHDEMRQWVESWIKAH